MPGKPVVAGFAFLVLGLVNLALALRRGGMHFGRWTDGAGNTHPGGGWQMVFAVVFTTCGLFNLWHQL